ncbi:MAG TPA: gliding motility protein GldN [Bacteroidia bacterium]|nr:gliding motility protein GldN [Bacteroidia bacterium]
MKRIAIILSLFIGISTSLSAQNVLDGVYVREHSPTRIPVPLSYLREADVMWSKKIWRIIDLKEKMNLAFYYPTEKINDRRSLNDILYDAVKEGTLTAYEDEEFTLPMTREAFQRIGGAGVDTTQITDPDPPYLTRDTVIIREFSTANIVAYRVKEEWFFDKQRSVMDVRIIGLAPLIYAVDDKGNRREGDLRIPIMWIYFPEARKILANQEVFIRQNDSDRRTWDDIFQKRMFASYIYKENNVYDRRIEDYKQGMDALVEADRIKNEITNMEHDLWEY